MLPELAVVLAELMLEVPSVEENDFFFKVRDYPLAVAKTVARSSTAVETAA